VEKAAQSWQNVSHPTEGRTRHGAQVKPIAAVSGADSAVIQQLILAFCQRQPASIRIAGVIEEARSAARQSTVMREIAGEGSYPVFQNLGPGASGCALDPSGIGLASEAVLRKIEAGCDLVVVSKFGKLEAVSGAGFVPVFIAAIEAGVPVLTSVSPRYAEAWSRFAGPYFVDVPAELQAIEAWWASVAEGAACGIGDNSTSD
jgi:hypothetical protein